MLCIHPIKANMTEVTIGPVTILFSYTTPVAYKLPNVETIYMADKFYSRTTSKHIGEWTKQWGLDNDNIVAVPESDFQNIVEAISIDMSM